MTRGEAIRSLVVKLDQVLDDDEAVQTDLSIALAALVELLYALHARAEWRPHRFIR